MECERPIQDSLLRQGDIFAAHPGTPNWEKPWRRFGVILSADCDIANGKMGDTLVFCPIVSLHTFLHDVWIPEHASKLFAQAQTLLTSLLGKSGAQLINSLKIIHVDEQEIRNSLEKPITKEQVERILETRTILKSLEDLRSPPQETSVSLIQRSQVLFSCHEKINPSSKLTPDKQKAILLNALSALSQSRFDTIPLCELTGLDPEMREDGQAGFVIDLRRFSTITPNKITHDRNIWLADKDSFVRVCRLRGIYKTDLLQKFANLFTRVGLEDDRKEVHRRIFDRIATQIVEKSNQ